MAELASSTRGFDRRCEGPAQPGFLLSGANLLIRIAVRTVSQAELLGNSVWVTATD